MELGLYFFNQFGRSSTFKICFLNFSAQTYHHGLFRIELALVLRNNSKDLPFDGVSCHGSFSPSLWYQGTKLLPPT